MCGFECVCVFIFEGVESVFHHPVCQGHMVRISLGCEGAKQGFVNMCVCARERERERERERMKMCVCVCVCVLVSTLHGLLKEEMEGLEDLL